MKSSAGRLEAARKEVDRRRILKLNHCTCLVTHRLPLSSRYKECFDCGGKKLMPVAI
tara:strand:+ start:394 stop:564 length:171 start_codon:yes stop_codon:yes gene_type:complete